MNNKKLSRWTKWKDRNSLENVKNPGVYCIAISDMDLATAEFKLIEAIKYIGMTNAIGGLKGRLNQFDNTLKGKSGHGGAE